MGKKIPRNITYIPPKPSVREQDLQMAREVLNGDEAAWDALYRKSVQWVTNAVKRTDTQHFFADWEYEDITDEAFARCYGHQERYQGLSQFHWWVLGYARNIMRGRRSRYLTSIRNQYLLKCAVEQQAYGQDPLRILMNLERDQYLWEAFFRLNATDRAIVYNRVFFQTAYRTLARELRLTQRQVRQRYQEAVDSVRWNFLRLYRVKGVPVRCSGLGPEPVRFETAPGLLSL